jgi:hypothetical protein
MTKRTCRNKINENGLTKEEVIQLAMDKMQWKRAKVLSWYKLENPHLNGARPEELVDRGDTDRIIELLDRRERERNKKKN